MQYLNSVIDTTFFFNLALQAIESGRDVEALCVLEKILHNDPNYLPSHIYLGWLLAFQFEDFTNAEKHFELAYSHEKADPFLTIHYAALQRLLGKHQSAIEIIKNAISIPKMDIPGLYYELGLNLEELDFQKDAIDAYKESIRHANENTNLHKLEEAIYRCELKKRFT